MRPSFGLPAALVCLCFTSFAFLSSCDKKPAAPEKRVELRRTGGTTFDLVPTEGQHEHCLAYTVNSRGLTRLLTMSKKNESLHCPAGKPLGGHMFKVPLEEGTVKIFVLFSSLPVNAGSVSQQILDLDDRQAVNIMNLRLPGVATLETLEFTPEEDVAATLGEALGVDAGAAPMASADADAGTPSP